MNLLVTFHTDTLYLADPVRRIFGLGHDLFLDTEGKPCRKSSTYASDPALELARIQSEAEDAAKHAYIADIAGGLSAFEVRRGQEPPLYGFHDMEGKPVIPPQYREVGQFAEGLCPVCIGMTTYYTPDGVEHHEAHWGYIDSLGKTVIPFAYRRACDFNRFGVAVVEDDNGSYLITTSGVRIEGTEEYAIPALTGYQDRFVEITPVNTEPTAINTKALLDTRDLRIITPPIYHDSMEWDENTLLVSQVDPDDPAIRRKWFIDADGAYKVPWQVEQNDIRVSPADAEGNSLLTSVRFLPADESVKSFFESPDGARYVRVVKVGLNSPDGKSAIPCAYDRIYILGRGLYAAVLRDAGTISVFG